MPPDKDGFRGALLIKKGIYKTNEPIRITTSGVVLRGEGRMKMEPFSSPPRKSSAL